MIMEYDSEPVRGLPGNLPKDERILWQGAPGWRRMVIEAFHVRPVAAWFAVFVLWAAIGGNWIGAGVTLAVGALAVGLLALLAYAASRTTVYTITNKRIVLRFGIALPKCINLPLAQVAGADLALASDGSGNVALTLAGSQRLGWIALWPHARPWRVTVPQPMLRAIPQAAMVADLLARATAAANTAAPAPAQMLAMAA